MIQNEQQEIKAILERIARNLATCAATVQALERYAMKQGWETRELFLLREEAKDQLEIVFNPLFEAIDALQE